MRTRSGRNGNTKRTIAALAAQVDNPVVGHGVSPKERLHLLSGIIKQNLEWGEDYLFESSSRTEFLLLLSNNKSKRKKKEKGNGKKKKSKSWQIRHSLSPPFSQNSKRMSLTLLLICREVRVGPKRSASQRHLLIVPGGSPTMHARRRSFSSGAQAP